MRRITFGPLSVLFLLSALVVMLRPSTALAHSATVEQSCLDGSGRIDINITNSSNSGDKIFDIDFQGLPLRQLTVPPLETKRKTFTGRRDGTYSITIGRNLSSPEARSVIATAKITISCAAPPQPPPPAQQPDTALVQHSCVNGSGYVTVKINNNSPIERIYNVNFRGEDRQQTIPRYNHAVLARTGVPDGTYTIRAHEHLADPVLASQDITISCAATPPPSQQPDTALVQHSCANGSGYVTVKINNNSPIERIYNVNFRGEDRQQTIPRYNHAVLARTGVPDGTYTIRAHEHLAEPVLASQDITISCAAPQPPSQQPDTASVKYGCVSGIGWLSVKINNNSPTERIYNVNFLHKDEQSTVPGYNHRTQGRTGVPDGTHQVRVHIHNGDPVLLDQYLTVDCSPNTLRAPTGLSVTLSGDDVVVSWNVDTGIDTYDAFFYNNTTDYGDQTGQYLDQGFILDTTSSPQTWSNPKGHTGSTCVRIRAEKNDGTKSLLKFSVPKCLTIPAAPPSSCASLDSIVDSVVVEQQTTLDDDKFSFAVGKWGFSNERQSTVFPDGTRVVRSTDGDFIGGEIPVALRPYKLFKISASAEMSYLKTHGTLHVIPPGSTTDLATNASIYLYETGGAPGLHAQLFAWLEERRPNASSFTNLTIADAWTRLVVDFTENPSAERFEFASRNTIGIIAVDAEADLASLATMLNSQGGDNIGFKFLDGKLNIGYSLTEDQQRGDVVVARSVRPPLPGQEDAVVQTTITSSLSSEAVASLFGFSLGGNFEVSLKVTIGQVVPASTLSPQREALTPGVDKVTMQLIIKGEAEAAFDVSSYLENWVQSLEGIVPEDVVSTVLRESIVISRTYRGGIELGFALSAHKPDGTTLLHFLSGDPQRIRNAIASQAADGNWFGTVQLHKYSEEEDPTGFELKDYIAPGFNFGGKGNTKIVQRKLVGALIYNRCEVKTVY